MAAWNGSGSQDVVTILQGVNTLANNLIGVMLLLIIFSVIYFMNKGDPTREALVGSLFVTLVCAVLLRFIGLIQDFQLGVVVTLFIGSLAFLWVRN